MIKSKKETKDTLAFISYNYIEEINQNSIEKTWIHWMGYNNMDYMEIYAYDKNQKLVKKVSGVGNVKTYEYHDEFMISEKHFDDDILEKELYHEQNADGLKLFIKNKNNTSKEITLDVYRWLVKFKHKKSKQK